MLCESGDADTKEVPMTCERCSHLMYYEIHPMSQGGFEEWKCPMCGNYKTVKEPHHLCRWDMGIFRETKRRTLVKSQCHYPGCERNLTSRGRPRVYCKRHARIMENQMDREYRAKKREERLLSGMEAA